ncbi:hypothetical protein C8035_v006263 [Colletotrichum spinosum]|uniref:Uncharacterized protein n=1 Tax=Colletotrichum spinosum TaxID=1347390 RepID=A0A4R8QJT2_9PEZI|nr:hypothetical protein C8035_v006263 [Colletotrichum spinosum]
MALRLLIAAIFFLSRVGCIPILGATTAEDTAYISHSEPPPTSNAFSEGGLVEVLAHNGSRVIDHTSTVSLNVDGTSPDIRILPRQYQSSDEDIKCQDDHDRSLPPANRVILVYYAWGSICQDATRVITCRFYEPEFLRGVDRPDLLSHIVCPKGQVCRQDGARQTKFGDPRPRTTCVPVPTIKQIFLRELKEACLRFPLPSTGNKKRIRVHEWAFVPISGLYRQVKWMYLKVNGAYVKSAQFISDWTVELSGVASSDNFEVCAFPQTGDPITVDVQVTIL